jgi:hypothetical protein
MRHEMSALGIDIAKRVFHAVGMDERGKLVLRKRLSRHALMPFMAQLPPVLIGMEAGGGAHYWARRFRAHGHEVTRMAPPVRQALRCDVQVASVTVSLSGAERTKPPVPPVGHAAGGVQWCGAPGIM